MNIPIKKLHPDAVLPALATAGSAGADLRTRIDQPVVLPPGGRALLSTGIAVGLPSGTVGLIFARSGLASKHGIALANGVGVVDSDYTGEVKVALCNLSDKPYTVRPGERVAQLAVLPVYAVRFSEVAELAATERGAGGFGSTGV